VLRRHLRPEFLNRIDEIVVFHALDRDQIREIVGLQLQRVKRTARGQGITLEFDESLVDHLAEVGYQPEYGARELRRRIRGLVETALASAMLSGEVGEGDTVRFKHEGGKVRWEKRTEAPAQEAKPAATSTEAARPAAIEDGGEKQRRPRPGPKA
jgi:ATP-dependent Clp protease ATP-binding subunit ClpC